MHLLVGIVKRMEDDDDDDCKLVRFGVEAIRAIADVAVVEAIEI